MTQLEDRRSTAAITSRTPSADDVGKALTQLLEDEPELELATVRLIQREDGMVGIAGRIGALAGVDCPQCHQPIGREHTEYCTLAPGKVWDGVLPSPCPKCQGEKLVANSDDQEPWSTWASLPPGSDLAVRLGLVQPVPCPECSA